MTKFGQLSSSNYQVSINNQLSITKQAAAINVYKLLFENLMKIVNCKLKILARRDYESI